MSKPATEYNHYRSFQQACTADDFSQIVKAAVQQAKDGDHNARLFIAAYAIGVPRGLDLKLSGIDLAEHVAADNEQFFAGLYPAKSGGKKR